MKIVRCATPHEFLDVTAAYRANEPARTNVLASVAKSVASNRRTYDGYWWWTVRDDADGVVGAAYRTAPFGLQLGPMPLAATAPLAHAVSLYDDHFPWLVGGQEIAERFLEAYQRELSIGARRRFLPGVKSRLYELGQPRHPNVEGACRVASADDIGLVTKWLHEFQLFVGDMPSSSLERDREFLLLRLNDGAFRLWCVDGEPVAMAGHSVGVESRDGMLTRIGPVFTPEVLRGRGYGSAVTAHLCGELTARGSRVMLYADVDNAASNRAYQKIGFHAVGDVIQYDVA